MRPLERPSLEAYGFGLVTIVSAVVPMTPWLRAPLILIGLLLVADIIWRSRWTISLRHHHKALILYGVVGLVSFLWFISRSRAQSTPAPPVMTASHVMPAPGPPAAIEKPPKAVAINKSNKPHKTALVAKVTEVRSEGVQPQPPQITVSAPNGIAVGGGTVTNPTVSNFGPRIMPELSAEQQVSIGDATYQYAGHVLSIDVNQPTADDRVRFANTLALALAKHMQVQLQQAMFLGGCATSPPGVSFMVGVNRVNEAKDIWSALVLIGAEENKPLPYCSRSGEPDELHIRVF